MNTSDQSQIGTRIDSMVSEKEAAYLKALIKEGRAYLEARASGDHAKTASFERFDKEANGFLSALRGAFGTMHSQAVKNPINAALAGGLVGIPMMSMIGQKAKQIANPWIENRRFESMMGMPGTEINVDQDQPTAYFVDPSLSPEERQEKALRKMFGLMHKYSPELTSEPEVARVFMNDNANNDPMTLVQNARTFASEDMGLAKQRKDLRMDLAKVLQQNSKLIQQLAGEASAGEGRPETASAGGAY